MEDDQNVTLFAPNRTRLNEAKEIMSKLFSSSDDLEIEFGTMLKVEVVEMKDKGVQVVIPVSFPVFWSNFYSRVENDKSLCTTRCCIPIQSSIPVLFQISKLVNR